LATVEAQLYAIRQKTPFPTPTFLELQEEAMSISYDELFRNNEKYVGKLVKYRGKVIPVINDGRDRYQLRVDVTQGEYYWG